MMRRLLSLDHKKLREGLRKDAGFDLRLRNLVIKLFEEGYSLPELRKKFSDDVLTKARLLSQD